MTNTINGCNHRRTHEHGTTAGYAVCGCRCNRCAEAQWRYTKYRKAGHTKHRWVDPSQARERLQELIAAGVSLAQIEDDLGLSHSSTRSILYRNPSRIKAETSTRILNYRGGITREGLVRRIQALQALGWPRKWILTRAHLTAYSVDQWTKGITEPDRRTRNAVCAIYDELAMTRPAATCMTDQRAITATLNRAAKHGWVPPLAWDDIDHDTKPVKGWQRTSDRPHQTDEVITLLKAGERPEWIANRLGVSERGVWRIASKNKLQYDHD